MVVRRGNATLKDVAERAGVHPGTASRALNPATQHLVSEATVRAVQEAARELDYRPNPMARGLKTNRSMMVGVVVPDLSNSLFPPIVRGAEDVLSRAGYTTVIADTDNDPGREVESLAALRARQVDGLLVASAHREDAAVQDAAAHGVPLVLVNRRAEGASIPTVVSDDRSGIEQAVRHLLELGHRRVAHLPGPTWLSTGLDRARAFREVMHSLGGDLDPALTEECVTYSVAEGTRAAHAVLERTRPTAILAGNDQIAVGVLDALRERGLRCPEDVSVVGYNDMSFMDKLSPPLTTVRVPHTEIGVEAAQILLRWLTSGPPGPQVVTLPVQLVVRGSTTAPLT
jgi:Transcriptional regulators